MSNPVFFSGVIDQLTGKLACIRNRELFFALYPSLSRLKTELALVRVSLETRRGDPGKLFAVAHPEFPLQIFRGGLVGVLQHLLPMT
jgi:hypothetical protein